MHTAPQSRAWWPACVVELFLSRGCETPDSVADATVDSYESFLV